MSVSSDTDTSLHQSTTHTEKQYQAANSSLGSSQGVQLSKHTTLLASAFVLVLAVLAAWAAFSLGPGHAKQQLTAITSPICGTWQVLDSTATDIDLSSSTFTAVSAVSDDDVWFGGERTNAAEHKELAFAHWDGKRLHSVPGSRLEADEIEIEALKLSSKDNGWAVGYSMQEDKYRLLTLRWNGVTWQDIPAPDIVTASNDPTTTTPAHELELSASSEFRNPQLQGVSIRTADDVWAVGHYPADLEAGTAYRSLTLHWNGSGWQVVPSPNLGTNDNYLNSVVSLGQNDVWAFGQAQREGTNDAGAMEVLAMHWDGNSWKLEDTVPTVGEIVDADVDESNDIWVINSTVNAQSYLAGAYKQSSATDWLITPMPKIAQPSLLALDLYSKDEAWAVGSKWSDHPAGAKVNQIGARAMVMYWDGHGWEEMVAPNPSYIQSLSDVAASASGTAWVVGFSADDEDSRPRGLVAHFSPLPCASTTVSP